MTTKTSKTNKTTSNFNINQFKASKADPEKLLTNWLKKSGGLVLGPKFLREELFRELGFDVTRTNMCLAVQDCPPYLWSWHESGGKMYLYGGDNEELFRDMTVVRRDDGERWIVYKPSWVCDGEPYVTASDAFTPAWRLFGSEVVFTETPCEDCGRRHMRIWISPPTVARA